jgi:6-phosphogluconolactonase
MPHGLNRNMLWAGLLLATLGSNPAPAGADCSSSTCQNELVYVGTHGSILRPTDPPAADTSAEGIYAARLDARSGQLTPLGQVARIDRANWLIAHPRLPIVYSVGMAEHDMLAEGTLYALSADLKSGQLRELNHVGAGGSDATHLSIDPASMTLFAANYGGGSVTVLPVDADGSLQAVVATQKHAGTGPSPRQRAPHAHSALVDPSGRHVISADLGADRVYVYNFDPGTRELTAASEPFISMAPGCGPRHVVFHPGGHWVFVNCEMTGEIHTFRWDAAATTLQPVQTISPYAEGYTGQKSSGELALSRDGKFLYMSLRFDGDALVTYTFDKRRGTLKEIQRVSPAGKTPWSFALDASGRWMLVANEASNSVNLFRVDPRSGKLASTDQSLSVPKPVAVLVLPAGGG